MVDGRLRDVPTFLFDGLVDAAPAHLLVSDDPATLDRHLAGLARAVVAGTAPPDFAGRGLHVAEAATVLDSVRDKDFRASLFGELASSGVTFGVRRIELLLGSADGRDFLDELLDAVRDQELGCLLGLTDAAGLAAVMAGAPRLLGFTGAVLLDERPPSAHEFSSLVQPPSSGPATERGWLVAVRLRLTAPAPALAALAAGSTVLEAGGVGAADDERVDDLWLIGDDERRRGLIVSVVPDAAGPTDLELAQEIALDAARTAVWRALRDGEELAVVRQVHVG